MTTDKNLLVIDLEATCSDDGSVARPCMEIIEIGCVMVERRSLESIGEFQSFVRPVRTPTLTEFCCNLTSIQQSDVDGARTFPEVIQELNEWRQLFETAVFCSWGAYDKSQFEQDCSHHEVPYPFDDEHANLKSEFSAMQAVKRMGMGSALRHVSLPLEGIHHRAIDDARNIAKLLRWIVA